jgi:Fe2+ or Zn2+ uptake regulation protein
VREEPEFERPVCAEEVVTADRRLRVLVLLDKAHAYMTNEHVLQGLLQPMGHAISVDRLRTDLAWLAEQGLLDVHEHDGLQVATLRRRGVDVANDRACVPGVARPVPLE